MVNVDKFLGTLYVLSSGLFFVWAVTQIEPRFLYFAIIAVFAQATVGYEPKPFTFWFASPVGWIEGLVLSAVNLFLGLLCLRLEVVLIPSVLVVLFRCAFEMYEWRFIVR